MSLHHSFQQRNVKKISEENREDFPVQFYRFNK